MNYIIEGNLDFKLALLDEKTNVNNICLISKQPLTNNHIKLPCNHTFNYNSLFKEIILQKKIKNPQEIIKLKPNQIKCPYCRNIINNILPYIPNEQIEKISGVNSPRKYCMPYETKWTAEMKTFALKTSVSELKQILRDNKLMLTGNKSVLVERIFAYNIAT